MPNNDDNRRTASEIIELQKQMEAEMAKAKPNPAWENAPYDVHFAAIEPIEITTKIEEVVVEATISYTMAGSIKNINDYLIKHHGFISGAFISMYYNIKNRTFTYKQKQRRIVKEPEPEQKYQYEQVPHQHEKWQKDIWEAMLNDAKNNGFKGPEINWYADYLKLQVEQEKKRQEDLEKAKKQQQEEEEKLNPLKFFSPKDLTE